MLSFRRWSQLLAVGFVLLVASSVSLHAEPPATVPSVTPADAPCCGVITPNGQHLLALLDSMDVEHHWLNHHRVDWKTGHEVRSGFQQKDTHCSAFAAAASYRLHVYLLRPPEHSQEMLANGQGRWLASEKSRREGWEPVTAQEAQRRANLGEFVVGVYVEADPHTHGHIVVIRPAEKTTAELAQDGPQDAMAGVNNYSSRPVAQSFGSHPNAWPDGIRYYAHKVPWDEVRSSNADANTMEQPQ